jgi:hypothetical protein
VDSRILISVSGRGGPRRILPLCKLLGLFLLFFVDVVRSDFKLVGTPFAHETTGSIRKDIVR